MASKEYIGLVLDSNRIYTARITKVKGGMELAGVETLELPEPLDSVSGRPQAQSATGADEDSVFGFDDEDTGESGALDLEESPEEEAAEDFDMSEDTGVDEAGEFGEGGNAPVLTALFNRIGQKNLNVGINVPIGKSILQQLTDVQPKKMKKAEREDFFVSKLMPVYDEDIDKDQYNWEVDETGNGWLISYDNDKSFLNLVDQADELYDGKVVIREMLSDEIICTGLARMHYELPEEEITGLVSIGKKTTRIIFLKGRNIIHVLPIINEGSETKNILETIFSKLLFEIDKGTITVLHRLLIMQSDNLGAKARDYLQEQFDDVRVELFRPDPEKLQLPEEYAEDPAALQPYMTAIGAAWTASGAGSEHFPALSLLPEYVRERQRVFKLEWHGVILLVLIAFAPLLVNKWYQDSSGEMDRLTGVINLTEARIAETQQIVDQVELLQAEYAVLQEINERITELSQQNLLWSETLDRLNRGMSAITSTWLNNLQVTGDNLHLEGYSLYRNQIPRVSEIFNDAHVMQVTEGEMRGRTIYRFTVQVRNFRDDDAIFTPEMPEFDGEIMLEEPVGNATP